MAHRRHSGRSCLTARRTGTVNEGFTAIFSPSDVYKAVMTFSLLSTPVILFCIFSFTPLEISMFFMAGSILVTSYSMA
jgi:hypothetical protein